MPASWRLCRRMSAFARKSDIDEQPSMSAFDPKPCDSAQARERLQLSRVMTTECALAFSRLQEPELSLEASPLEGAGNAGCLLHPRSRVHESRRKCAHEHTGTVGALRHSLRKGVLRRKNSL